MRKLKLHLDGLQVESFTTREQATARPGTVEGHMPRTENRTCGNNVTCYNTCDCPSWSGPECNTVCVG